MPSKTPDQPKNPPKPGSNSGLNPEPKSEPTPEPTPGVLRRLPLKLVNQIAAGEVVERPANALKELIENSIDAGARKIQITLHQGGKSLIDIKDDGIGMNHDNALMALERHATSKLPDNNLNAIRHFGFRGEALPAIASVSRFAIKTRPNPPETPTDTGWEINCHAGEIMPAKPAPCPPGTHIAIRDLFYLTPARLKFLRADHTEMRASMEIIKSIALAHPEIAFSVHDQNRQRLSLPATEDSDQRISDIMGDDFIANSRKMDFETPSLHFSGRSSFPTWRMRNRLSQFLFVNGRPVKDKFLNAAIAVAYRDFMPPGFFPALVLFLTIAPEDIDVNVHPAKTEIRFQDPQKVKTALISAITNLLKEKTVQSAIAPQRLSTLFKPATGLSPSAPRAIPREESLQQRSPSPHQQNSFSPPTGPPWKAKPTLENHALEKPDLPEALLESKEEDLPLTNQSQNLPLTDRSHIAPAHKTAIEDDGNDRSEYHAQNEGENQGDNGGENHGENETENHGENHNVDSDFPLGFARAQLHENYIIAQTPTGIVLIDQHAAHERIIYEKFKKNLIDNQVARQVLLMPELIELGEELCQNLLSLKDNLAKTGLIIDSFGPDTLIVREMPALLGTKSPKELLLNLVNILEADDGVEKLHEKLDAICATMACHASIRSGRRLKPEEMNSLLRQIEKTPFSEQCNHGRPTYVSLSLKDIEKLFARR